MTEDEAVRILYEHFKGLFPKVCPNCSHCFNSVREYIEVTKRLGPPICYDAELGKWDTNQPVGSIAMTVCKCGTTLALSTAGMDLPLRLELLKWLKDETERRGVPIPMFLDYLRDRVRHRVCQLDK